MVDFDKVRNELENDVDTAGGVAREVLAKRAAIVGVITTLLTLAVGQGWFGVDVSNNVLKWVNVIFVILTVLGTILVARPALTPVGDPKDSAGETLVPVSAALAQVEKAVNEAEAGYKAVKSGDLSNAPQLVADVTKAAQDLVVGVAADVNAVVAPVKEAAGDKTPTVTVEATPEQPAQDSTFGGTLITPANQA